MFTVVIAEKEHIDSIGEYDVFLKPLMNEGNFAFCEWRPEETTLSEAVPHLTDVVGRRRDWRVIVLCDERGLNRKNPFEVVEYKAPEFVPLLEFNAEEEMYEHRRKYLELVRETKFRAFEQAAQQPLTRLMTHLCQAPLVTRGKNRAAETDPDFAEYLAENRRKEELREQIINGEKLSISQPGEVICIAKRTCVQPGHDMDHIWKAHEDYNYSRFYDWNLYFDKMRYLVFDILPKDHQDYQLDYIRFLYSLVLLAKHEIPTGVLRPNRVFTLLCENDEDALVKLLALYDAKLAETTTILSEKVNEIRRMERPRLSDQDAKMLFCSNVNIPVTAGKEVSYQDLYADPASVGISTDHPGDEFRDWEYTYQTSRKTLHKILKQPRRAIRSAAADTRRMNQANLDQAAILNEFQADDVRDYTAEEELNMVSVETLDLHDTERYDRQMEASCREIRQEIKTRMTRKTTVTLSLLCIGLYLVGFLPLLFNNLSSRENLKWSAVVIAAGLVLLGLVILITLLAFRSSLRKLYHSYNHLMRGIDEEIHGSLGQYSKYLSHACNVMRGFSVTNYLDRKEDPDALQIRVYEKHMSDIRRIREELRELFGPYVFNLSGAVPETVDAYPYDFSRPVDFPYPVPCTEGMKGQIEFMQPGVTVQVPIRFVKRLAVRREELYD